MKTSARMLLMRSNQNNGGRRGGDYGRNEYNNDYATESRFRDDRGREHYNNGRYAPMRSEYPQNIWAEKRQDYGRSEYNEYAENRGRRAGNEYGNREGQEPMGVIGFSMDRRPQEYRNDYRTDTGYHNMNEMEQQSARQMQRGYTENNGQRLSHEEAMNWAREMKNEDGTKGPLWSMEQAKQVMAQKGVECDPLEFWLALNMMYSDYCKVFRKHGVGDKIDFYVDMAKAFLDDKDAYPDKLTRYYDSVVRH